ncbi:caspase family protein [Enterococcus mundtii]|uniref:Peptidase C14 n=1 Tax=Enterococcus mundtii TaxID=53346 RepID=A0A2S7RR30_ENTMU|nr:caspase family protein [Enterococcus mundtii]PQF22075.1 peptidase C14 [Enterococcus mundtii]
MKKALVIGIDEYKSGYSLTGCVNDARDVAEMLKRHKNGDINYTVYLEENIESKNKLTIMIQELFEGDCESALLYFSGHGFVDKYGLASLVTPDLSPGNMGVSMDDILNWANKSKIKNKVIILDCCFAGNMGNFSGDGTRSSLSDGVTILTASKADEPSIEFAGHGIFTALLISALEGGASDLLGYVTPGSIYSYIDKALGPWEQRPVFKSNVSTFDIIRRVNSSIDIALLRELPRIFNQDHTLELNPSFEVTNTTDDAHEVIEPYANSENVKLFKKLQKLTSCGLVRPVGEDHMYYAAMRSKSCELTTIGKYYHRLAEEEKI